MLFKIDTIKLIFHSHSIEKGMLYIGIGKQEKVSLKI
nr:MAG TPA: hypothetical protein [Caudoviricetes sp.]